MTIEVTDMGRCSCKAYEIKYIEIIRLTPKDIAIKERETYYITKASRLSCMFVETIPLFIDNFKSKEGNSVLEKFAVFQDIFCDPSVILYFIL